MQIAPTVVLNPLAYRKNTLILLLCLLAMAGVQSFGMYRYFHIPVGTGSIDAVISWFFVGALMFFTTNTLSYYHPSKGKGLYVAIMPLVLGYIWLKLTEVLILAVIKDVDYVDFFSLSKFYRFSVVYLILAGTTLFSFIWYQLGEKEGEQRRKEETDRMAKEAELFKLRQQLQPHFLFNSLNSINSLIGTRPQEARAMVQQLSDFLRGTLRREDQRFITLGEELEYLRLYLDIEEVRFGHRLKVEINCEEEHLEWKLPPLILQPIMENAIKFGLYGTTKNLEIVFRCKSEDNILLITIVNPYDSDMQSPKGTGFGLSSVKRRLFLLYSRKDLLVISQKEGLFTVQVKLPKLNA